MIIVKYIGIYSKKALFKVVDAWSKIPEYEYWQDVMIFNDLTM